MQKFDLVSKYKPAGDQPKAIENLTKNIDDGEQWQVLLGATGTGKTFTMANVIQNTNKPSLIICHNKTLAAQLYSEFKEFFPNNAVEYFVSHFDFFLPESYNPTSGVYVAKDSKVNDELEKLRLSCVTSLLSRRDTIVIASVSCLFGAGNPSDIQSNVVEIHKGQDYGMKNFLLDLSHALFSRKDVEPDRGTFRVKGDTVEVFLAHERSLGIRVIFWGNEIEHIESFNPETGRRIQVLKDYKIWPANLYVTKRSTIENAVDNIKRDLEKQIQHYEDQGLHIEAKRIQERTEYDVEMMLQMGFCQGIENYSRYIDGREAGVRPFCLLDYFPKDGLVFIDESHATIPQMRAMYGSNRAMKTNLVEYGWRLPSALDNRPLRYEEAEQLFGQTIFVSATPGDYELGLTEGEITEQIIRPTGLLDPKIEVFPTKNQIDKVLELIHEAQDDGVRVLITTLTKKMAEHMSEYLRDAGISSTYLHSELKTPERVAAIRNFRLGKFNALVGVNMLREGLDMPEVGLVIIMDADKEGYLRNFRAMIQTIGRAARNEKGRAVMFADKMTGSMKSTIEETHRRRAIQDAHNIKNNITPKTLWRTDDEIIMQTKIADKVRGKAAQEPSSQEPEGYMYDPSLKGKEKKKAIEALEKEMFQAAKDTDFVRAAQLRDLIQEYKK